ncbi:hypothetical protein Agabi119p4_7518 [Agaricus bisporus var. burnettii]|uniref:BTB domain-containing protein n=1 Tax=Agaricus bisporus var. burnettii TaxID=192524 RepID=A0A8H7EZL3_AGABI|nr:hypothetical protein Agabi119p4_7518 [Agaricus bisporus var. burnettii]
MVFSGESSEPNNYVRDKDYYFEDGSLVILAKGYLFKIHRMLFERDSPFFRSLLSLPQGEGSNAPEGQSDEDPIICPDSAEDFRALCWVVYSRPADILQQQGANTIKVSELTRVVAITHKYEFDAYCEWAWNALDAHFTAFPSNFFHKCGTWGAVGRIFKLAIECEKRLFVDRMEQVWFRRISSPSPSSDRTIAFREALVVAEGSDHLREFQAKSYYAYLQSSGLFEKQVQHTVPIELDGLASHMDESLGNLSSERRMRLLTGFWSLSQLRLRMSQPPKLMDNPSCARHTSDCVPCWESWWKDILNNATKIGDPGKLIDHISNTGKNISLGQHSPSNPTQVTNSCTALVRSKILMLKKDFDDSLANRFMVS